MRDIDACVEIIRSFYVRGWVLGTGGNFSVLLTRKPFRLAITSSGIDKGIIAPEHFPHVDASGNVVEGTGKPTAEAGLHLAVLAAVNAGAVFHTHSVWATLLSTIYFPSGGLHIEGYEMLKGLHGVDSHTHREWLPIIENSQNIPSLGDTVQKLLEESPTVHGFLIRGHGLYTWGKTIYEAKQHVEIFEFLLEVIGRRRTMLIET
ncbi:MAG: methylthioribulose 1-phosphate dehydratase [Nitrospiraceae bacterium]|nr:methylthioribulose 1-phosphate dehydratase [Nitrospiraceae bacterium]